MASPLTNDQSRQLQAASLYIDAQKCRSAKKLEQAFERFLESAQLGHARAMYEVSHCYREGVGALKNLSLADSWRDKSLNGESADHDYNQGLDFEERAFKRFQPDLLKAAICFERSAWKGNPDAWMKLADYYKEGKGVGRSDLNALRCYETCAQAGHIEAMRQAADLHIRMNGNYRKAAGWYQKAAEKGHLSAKFQLGKLLWSGAGVAKDRRLALFYITQAAEKYQPARTWCFDADKGFYGDPEG